MLGAACYAHRYRDLLNRGYARLYRAPPPRLEHGWTQRFDCALNHHVASEYGKEPYSAMDCGFTASIGPANVSASSPSLAELQRRRRQVGQERRRLEGV